MPEIMSQNIFPTMREDHEIPILTLIMDEQTGKAGYITRLEAFVDLMRRRKRKNGVAMRLESESSSVSDRQDAEQSSSVEICNLQSFYLKIYHHK
jgi:predicted nucleotide-binding protein (sugar kinase/HSP70/actin superfamily)